MGIQDLKYKIKKPCKECPYKLGLVETLKNPCPECKENGFRTYERLIKPKGMETLKF